MTPSSGKTGSWSSTAPAGGLEITPGRVVPWSEIQVRTARSGGPGGQNVNKVETQVEISWDLRASEAFGAREKARLEAALGKRLVRGAVLRLRSRTERTQSGNRRAALTRLKALLVEALRPRKKRRASAPTAASKEARLEAKHRHSRRKRERRPPGDD